MGINPYVELYEILRRVGRPVSAWKEIPDDERSRYIGQRLYHLARVIETRHENVEF
jgi:hypothetical protein